MDLTQSIFYHCFKLHMLQHSSKQPTIAQAGERHGTVLDDLGENKLWVWLLANLTSNVEAKDNHGKTTPELMLFKGSKYK